MDQEKLKQKQTLMAIGLPPKAPSSVGQGAASPKEIPSNRERQAGIEKTPQMSSERYWANFTLRSHERKELERLVDASRYPMPNSGRSHTLQVLKDDSLFMRELDKFLI